MNKRAIKAVRRFDLDSDREALLEQSGKLLEDENFAGASTLETDVIAGLMLFGPSGFSLRWPWVMWENDRNVFRRVGVFPNLEAISRVSIDSYGSTIVDQERRIDNDPVTIALQLYGTQAKRAPIVLNNESQSIISARIFLNDVNPVLHREILRRAGFTRVTCLATAALLRTQLNAKL